MWTSDRTILVFAPNWLGDAVMALPAMADIPRLAAQTAPVREPARLVVAARQPVAPLFTMVPGIDEVVTLRWKGSVLRRAAIEADTRALAAVGAEVAILLPNSFASAWLAKRAGIPERWGYATDWRGPLLTRAARRPRGSRHQGEYYRHLVAQYGTVVTNEADPRGGLRQQQELRVPEPAMEKARALLQHAGWDGAQPLVTIAPGAAYGTAKRWLPAHVATLLVRLAREHGVRGVLVGSAGDAETIRMIRAAGADAAVPQAIDLVGRTSLEELAAVLSLSAACVSNDSGAMHLAGALGVRLVALFGPTREYETAPLTRRDGQAEILINPVWCRPCMLRECPIDHRCMRGLEPARVASAVGRMLA